MMGITAGKSEELYECFALRDKERRDRCMITTPSPLPMSSFLKRLCTQLQRSVINPGEMSKSVDWNQEQHNHWNHP
jgi:hypothetical protein